jgi:soluble lytic murein transglycosylase-like protein
MRIAVLLLFGLAFPVRAGSPEYFTPLHRISGIGIDRDDLSQDLLDVRTDLMIQSQTFIIMREAQAVAGARRVTSDPALQAAFREAAARSGLSATLIEAIAYLESWGDAKAESPAGPKGIMQISAATAHDMGLPVIVATRYRVTHDKVLVPSKSKTAKPKYKIVTHKTAYTVTLRDDRLIPSRAIPAAAVYLAGMQQRYGGIDWAIFAYHCGQGCVNEMLDLTRRSRGVPKDAGVARMFFSATPAWNRELYDAIQQQMQRDYSPTYYFRIKRAEQLLDFYRRDPDGFISLWQQHKSDFTGPYRAPHRLAVWLKRDDLVFHTCDDIRASLGGRLVRPLDRPWFFGYTLNIAADSAADRDSYLAASPAAMGTLTYIAFETHRLFDELNRKGERFKPLPVTALVEPEDRTRGLSGHEAIAHSSGQVFDIDYSALPPGELECLRFVLDDLGWAGYLGFIEDGRDSLHIGCSPASREFFAAVFDEAIGKEITETIAPEAGVRAR